MFPDLGRRLARPLLAVAALASLVSQGAELRAQPGQPGQPGRDYDQGNEEYSEFWEQALAADDAGYEEQLRNAIASWDAKDEESRSLALSILRDAIKAKPKKVQAYFWLGQLQFEGQDWQGCSESLERAYELDPTFLPKLPRKNSSLEKNLASCYLYQGDYERAIHHFQRLITVSRESRGIELRLGEALMAVGRLEEATQHFRNARKSDWQSEPLFALAVALDRAERFVESRKLLDLAVNRDRKLRSLLSAQKLYGPPEDQDYYLGLARKQQGQHNLALYHFRRYQHQAPNSPWKKRVDDHLRRLGSPDFASDIELRGSAIWIRTDVLKAVKAEEQALRSCMKGHPLVLARVSLSKVKKNRPEPAQVNAIIEAHFQSDDDTLDAIVACLEDKGRRIKTPTLSGSAGSHSTASFTVLGE